jgi:recombination protein RecR
VSIPASLERLVAELARLPGVGQKTAQRLAFSILRNDATRAHALARAIEEVKERIRFCEQCFGYAEGPRCAVCGDGRRDPALLCVVEQPGDIYVIERSGVFRGLYHVLQGVISPLDGIGPDQLKVRELVARVERDRVEELILATNPSMQGEATALHLSRLLAGKVGRITRLARGMPVGANLEFTDDVTLNQAFSGRQVFGG